MDAIAEIPAQPGLEFEVIFHLQADELHLEASRFHASWFPCGDEAVFHDFLDALLGLLSGSHRILESFVGRLAVKAWLQRLRHGSWETIAVYSNLGALIPWKRSQRVLQNRVAP